MSPDDFQKAWKAESDKTRVSVNTDSLTELVRRARKDFRTIIFWRDTREVGAALLWIPAWVLMGVFFALPWTWYLGILAFIWIAAFIAVDRRRHPQQTGDPGESLLENARESIAQVEHQIWLLRNVAWWNLLPGLVALIPFFAQVSLRRYSDWWGAAASFFGVVLFVIVVDVFVYYINQRAVRKDLQPRRQELLALVRGLEDGALDDNVESFPILEREQTVRMTWGRMLFAAVCFVLILAVGVPAILHGGYLLGDYLDSDYPKRAPYAAVRWEGDEPVVQLEGEWYGLVSLDDVPVSEIVSFSQRTYGDRWQKRFEEDLVEVLTRMGHPPGETVDLVVWSLSSSETRLFEDVPMTRANRDTIWDAAQDRQSRRDSGDKLPAVSIDDGEAFRSAIDDFLGAAHEAYGFSGAVIVARGGEPVYEGAYGFSHLDTNAPNTLDTPFRIASLSKQFTAAVIFRLEAAGMLEIDAPVYTYLEEFDIPTHRAITIHHLLTHSSGLPRIPQGPFGGMQWSAMSRKATPVDDYVALAVETPLEFEPGADFQYSNMGYRVLSALIARVTGQEYADYMESELFDFLGMASSGVARVDRPESESHIADGLVARTLPLTSELHFTHGEADRNFGTGYGSGGVFASARDLLTWDRVLAGDAYLSAAQKARLFDPVYQYYACGWIVKKSGLDGRVYQTHSGANQGFFSQMMRIPEDDLVIIAVGNVDKSDELDEVIEQLFRLCRSLPYRPAVEGGTMEETSEVELAASGSAFALELERIRASYKLPAMAAFAIRGDEVIEQATVGTVSLKDSTPVGPDAPWHLGSNTKAMTATVAGMLMEDGLLRWDLTVGEVLGETAPDMHAKHRDTTLADLLHHIAGITPNIAWFSAPEDRVSCAAEILKRAPQGKRGKYLYSNAGYVVAGAMMEAVTGEPWEEVIRERLFEPLGMSSTSFGAPVKPGSPWGHRSGLLSWTPMDPNKRKADNAPVLGPAGTVHSTLDDYAKFIAAHLKGARGAGGIVSAETFATLHTPFEGGDYAMGWIVTERSWAGGRALTHGGSNTLWFATAWLAPEKNMAYFAVTNAGGNTAFRAVDEAVSTLIGWQ